jgi:hypothetical protein
MALIDDYKTTLGTDLGRDGMFLELSRVGNVVAEAFYSDTTQKISIRVFESLPIEAVDFLSAEARRRLPPKSAVDESLEPEYLLDIQTDSDGSQVFMHADAEGLAFIERAVSRLRQKAESGECDHDHLFAQDWGGNELSTSSLSDGMRHVSHMKIYAWSKVWLAEHPRDNKS